MIYRIIRAVNRRIIWSIIYRIIWRLKYPVIIIRNEIPDKVCWHVSNIYFPRFVFVDTFKRKFLSSYRSLKKKKNSAYFENPGVLSLFSQLWLWFAQIGENRWFPQLSPVRHYSLGVTQNYFSESSHQK